MARNAETTVPTEGGNRLTEHPLELRRRRCCSQDDPVSTDRGNHWPRHSVDGRLLLRSPGDLGDTCLVDTVTRMRETLMRPAPREGLPSRASVQRRRWLSGR